MRAARLGSCGGDRPAARARACAATLRCGSSSRSRSARVTWAAGDHTDSVRGRPRRCDRRRPGHCHRRRLRGGHTAASGTPNAVADSATPLGGFPTDGLSYAILTSGDANLADDPNASGSSGASDGGSNVRGNTDFDVTILRIDLDVPAAANCLTIDFRFLSEEFPEYVGGSVNDAFIAELDVSDWTTVDSAIDAPHNFAFDADGNVISVNTASMSAPEAAGTTYDGATPLLSASTPVDAGAHSLYLSIFDQGDSAYDSAVFVDALVLGTTGPGGCEPGATVVSMDKDVDDSSVQPGDNVTYTITVTNEGGDDAVLSSITDTLPDGFTYVSGSTSGITADEPTVTGQDLTWDGPFTVPGEVVLLGSIELSFSATASHAPGSYFNNASAQGDEVSVTPTGPDAPVTVEAPATGNIVIQKATSPECDSTVFDFTADYDESGFQLAGCEQNDSGPLDPGTYSVSELAEAGWELTETSCSDGSEVTAIDLDAGETVTCTFLNEQTAGRDHRRETHRSGRGSGELRLHHGLQRSVLALRRTVERVGRP